jgi:Rod binding domain-containing protein
MTISAIASQLASAEPGQTPPAARASAAECKKVAGQFEAILIRQLLSKSLTSMLGSEDNAASSVYGDMLTDTLAQQLTAGPGLGLGSMIATQLMPRGPAVGTPAATPPKP